jgi:threonine dehydrogenase-like Zn-dependent dehydrogenase
MRSIWLENNVVSYREDVEKPSPKNGEVLIKVRLAGICATDLEMTSGYYPFCGIMGHEFVGDVVEAPDAPQWIGSRVVADINITCGKCKPCVSGYPTHCENRNVLGILDHQGVFAEYVTLPVENIHPLPMNLADDVAVFTEPLASLVEILERVHIQPSQKVLILGAGRIGLLAAQLLRLIGCDLLVVARHEKQCSLLSSKNIPFIGEDALEGLKRSVDVVVETTGSKDGFPLAYTLVRPRGTIVMKSTFKGDIPVNISQLAVSEITVIGTRCGPFPPAIRLLENGLIDPLLMIDQRFPLSEGVAALKLAAKPGILKVLLEI